VIKAVLFDMDGVLIDAKDWHYEALNEALGLFGLEISRYDHLHTFDGLPTKVKLKMLAEQYYLPEQLHSFINQVKQQHTIMKVNERCHPMFEHEYALSRLHSEGYKIAVCSNSIRNTIESMMDKSALTQYLDLIVSNEDVKKAKPDPEMYTTAINKFGLKPDECLVVEDNINGVEAGLASGAFVLKVETVHDVNYSNISKKIKEVEHD
jgi:HAD superfamily hydrolase (TIGR01509 family)